MNYHINSIHQNVNISNVCHGHSFQLSFSSVPPAKVCSNCGKSEALTGKEICWPWTPGNTPGEPWRVGARVNILGISILIFFSLFLVKLYYKHFHSSAGFTPQNNQVASKSLQQFLIAVPVPTQDKEAGPSYDFEIVHPFPHDLPSIETQKLLSSLVLESELTIGPQIRRPETDDLVIESTPTLAQDKATPDRASQQAKSVVHDSETRLDNNSFNKNNGNGSSQNVDTHRIVMERRIIKAIANRAITGVKVSFAKNTARLEGIVKTDNQRLAAEQAARSVQGVTTVISSIKVEWF